MSVLGWLSLAALFSLAPRGFRTAARHRHRTADPTRRRPGPGLAALTTAILAVLLGGTAGAMVALPLALAVGWLVRKRTTGRTSASEPRSMAFILDLVASALAGGSPPELAIAGVAAAVAEHGTERLRRAVQPLQRVGRLLQLGTDPSAAWGSLRSVPGYGPVADCGRRCANSGARLAGALALVAAELRSRHQAEALARAQRVGVWSLLPLGCCFLPAFVCLGVVPVVAGIAGQVLPPG